jgi:hypothetical protein
MLGPKGTSVPQRSTTRYGSSAPHRRGDFAARPRQDFGPQGTPSIRPRGEMPRSTQQKEAKGLVQKALRRVAIMPPTMLFATGKYRLRTWVRAHAPYFIADRIPKGRKDCGNHEWYRSDEYTDHCYHCEVGIREHGMGGTAQRVPVGSGYGPKRSPRPRVL